MLASIWLKTWLIGKPRKYSKKGEVYFRISWASVLP